MKFYPILFLLALPFALHAQNKTYNIVNYGAKADGVTNNAISIQKAIDDANAQGGGTVLIPQGTFLTGVISLKSNVTLNLAPKATLLGTAIRNDYGGAGEASPLIVANHLQNIGITGKGTIDGNGTELLKDLLRMLNDGSLKDSAWGKLNPWHQMQPQESNRPKIIGFNNCKGIQIKGITLLNSLDWVQDYKNCTDIVVDSIKVVSNTYWNNDGIDIVDCKNVKITNSFFNADDDGICLKSEERAGMCENVYVDNCTVRSSASAVKLGTASYGGFRNITIKNIKVYDTYRSAIAIESVDGGIMENINVSNIHATNTGNAFYIRLGHRNKDSVMSTVNGIRISNLTAEIPAGKPDKGYPMDGPPLKYPHNVFPSSIAGLPGYPVKNVVLEDIHITYHGVADKTVAHVGIDSLDKIPENAEGYPEFTQFGELPAWGLYARHAQGITLKNVTVSCVGDDFRPACVFDDIQGLALNNVAIPQVKSLPVIFMRKTTGYSSRGLKIPGKAKNKVKIQ